MRKIIKSLLIICTIVLVLRGIGYTADPNWTPVTTYANFMSLASPVYLDNFLLDNTTTVFKVGAFGPTGDCRGVVTVDQNGYAITIMRGDTTGETITFKIYDAAMDKIYDLAEDVSFVVGGTHLGDLTSSCNDGVYCNGTETFDDSANQCQAGTAPCTTPQYCDEAGTRCVDCLENAHCDDGVGCTEDTCNTSTGVCSNTPNNALCDDTVACTVDTCDQTAGCSNTPNNALCDDDISCTVDTCSATAGCSNTPDNALCDDGVGCTVDTCSATADCVFTPDDALCDDGVGCTVDTCSATADCVFTPDDTQCDDGVGCTVDTCDQTADCVFTTDDALCDDGVDCTVDICSATTDCSNAPNDALCDDNDPCTIDSCDTSAGLCLNLLNFDNPLYATGQEYDGNSQEVEVLFGLDSGAGSAESDPPTNWSLNNIVRLQLIDPNVDITDPNNIVDPDDLLTVDIRAESSGPPLMWYVMVEIGDLADPNADNYDPVLGWDTLDCPVEVDGNPCVYALRSGLGDGGTVLVADMTDTNSFQTVSQEGDPPIQHYTIQLTCPEQPEVEEEEEIIRGPAFPWPGVSRSLGWGLPISAGFPGGLPYPMRSGYASGLSIPSFPGTYTGFTYPGGPIPTWTSYPAVTSYLPRFPVTFPTLGIFSPLGRYGWPQNYWSGYNRPFPYQTGWFYTYR